MAEYWALMEDNTGEGVDNILVGLPGRDRVREPDKQERWLSDNLSTQKNVKS